MQARNRLDNPYGGILGMDVLLVNPPAPDVESLENAGINAPPLGLAYIAAVLERGGYKVDILDCQALRLSMKRLREEIKARDPYILGITSTTPTIYSALKVAKLAKEVDGDITTVIGGPHVTFTANEVLDSSEDVDFVVAGEGEYTMLELLKALEGDRSLKEIRGITFRDKGKIVKTPSRGYIEDLDSLPFPARHLLPMDKYKILGRKLTVIHVVSSRGCPFRCIFCSSSALCGKRFRARSVENMLDEIEEAVERYKTRHVEFIDDTFTLNRRRTVEFCEEVKRRRLDISWNCSSRVDTIDEDLMRKMREAGCSIIFFGVESASQRTLDLIGKGITVDRAVKAINLAKRVGIEVLASFVIGFPWETIEDMKETIRFAAKLKPDFAEFSVATPYPGTALYEKAEKEGLIEVRDWSKYTAVEPVMRGYNFTVKDVKRLIQFAYMRFYLSPGFIINQFKKKRWLFASVIPRSIISFIREMRK